MGARVAAQPPEQRGRLHAVQAIVEAQVAGEAGARRLYTLDPARERPSTLAQVHAKSLESLGPELGDALSEPLVDGLCDLALAQLDAFPGNLFWDLDLIAAVIVDEVSALGPEPARTQLRDRFARMVALQHLYGRRTVINFSYVHDFVYGFDWAKWIAREPSLQAAAPGPFSLAFLTYMQRRGEELLELIELDDSKYPALDGDEPRNPFPFSREPAAELRLHRELARRDLIPVPTWSADPHARDWSTRWRVAFAAERVDVASELGLCESGDSQ